MKLIKVTGILCSLSHWVLGIGYWVLGIGYWVLGIGEWGKNSYNSTRCATTLMPTGIFTNAWITQSAEILFRGATAPDPTKFRLCLANTATLTRSNLLADFLASELLPNNGYARASASIADGSYNTTNQRYELPTISATFSATGGALQFQTPFLMANSAALCSQSFTNANVNPTTDRITITAHGYANGDQLIFTADALATLPSGIVAGTIYTVSSVTTNDFQLTGVNITDTGSGTFRARNANGIIVAYAVESSPITLADGQGYSYQIPLVLLNSGYVNGS
ncbi:MAG: hypothetical protein V7L26_14165 [Nostoc sp.]|uniref:hypothetical protein n=1 Tax=Nostoc sp. TaxID=1180 RepID=UPI002FF2A6A3